MGSGYDVMGYGMMGSGPGMMESGSRMMGGMMMDNAIMGSCMIGSLAVDAETKAGSEDAVDMAQEYLDTYLPGVAADETADPFPGYYTIHILRDGDTIRMLTVNAHAGQVFFCHWHSDFMEMVGEERDYTSSDFVNR